MSHRLRLPEIRRQFLRDLQRLDGPAFVRQEAAKAWDMPVDEAEGILETMEDVGLLGCRQVGDDRIWWHTELAMYDIMCAPTT